MSAGRRRRTPASTEPKKALAGPGHKPVWDNSCVTMRVRLAPFAALLLAGGVIGSAGEPSSAPSAFGTAHPGLVEAMDPAGRWIVVCQARADTDNDGKIETFIGIEGDPYGDDPIPYLVVGGGDGSPLGTLVAVDPASRYVVGAPRGRVTLFDTRTGKSIDLTPKAAHEGEPTFVEGWASFDDVGRRLLTARIRGAGDAAVTRLVVRELESGVETSLDPGPGLFVRAALSGDGGSIDVVVVAQDTDGNGKLEAPRQRGSLYQGGCAGPASGAYFGARSGDKPTHRVLAVDGGLRRDVPGFVGFVGRRWIRRLEEGSLVLEAAAGERTTIAAAALKGRVLASDDASGLILFASCVDLDDAPVYAAGTAGVRDIGVRLEIPEWFHEATRRDRGRITPILRSDGPAFDWLKAVAFNARGKWLACEGAKVLVLRDSNLVVLDVDSATEAVLPGKIDHDVYEPAWRAGPLAAAGGVVLDLVGAKMVGTYPYPLEYPYPTTVAASWGLRDDGAVLRSAGPSASERRPDGSLRSGSRALPSGPFRWKPPTPPK